jgi:hypothetical protein
MAPRESAEEEVISIVDGFHASSSTESANNERHDPYVNLNSNIEAK